MIFKEGLSSILTVMPISTAADVEGQPNLPSRPQTSQPRQTAFRTIPFPAPLFILRSHRAKILKVKKGIKNEMLASGGIVKTYRFIGGKGVGRNDSSGSGRGLERVANDETPPLWV